MFLIITFQTQSELSRCLAELTRPKISHFTEEELRLQDEAYLASLPKPKHATTAVQREIEKPKLLKQPTLSKEEEAFREKWFRLVEMVSKGRLDALRSFLDRESVTIGGIDAPIPGWAGEKQSNILQVAVAHGHEAMTQWLLEDARADPTIPLSSWKTADDDEGEPDKIDDDLSGASSRGGRRTAYDLAKTKAIRDIFRRVAAAHPEWWDWFGAGRVPSALSQEMEEERGGKKKTKRKGLKDRIKERQVIESEEPVVVEVAEEPTSLIVNATARRLGGLSDAFNGIAGLTPEMSAKVERERRARAAEARLKALR